MKLGMITDSLGHLPFDSMLEVAGNLGFDMLEFACGNWSKAPHVDLDLMLADDGARRGFLKSLDRKGIAISALNCSGNPLHPGEHGRRHDAITRKTLALANKLGVTRIVMMSGLPGGAPGDTTANWVTTAWPAENQAMLHYQWDKVVIPYWKELAAEAKALGIKRICLELHGHQAVYSASTLAKLRGAVGDIVGANFDPSHLMWMGADPIAAIRALGPAIYHVHAKDTAIDPVNAGRDGILETIPNARIHERAWNYVTLGYGRDEAWWNRFCMALAMAGYDDVLSIEHEDVLMSPEEGVEKSVALLRRVMVNQRPKN
ncbi:MAG: sugar phosphate isomerase/epimerase [Alphaproteobacteria bacterium]|nr:sugar phosphate isomerase/epimerase [Alphaproteobacteria bacterium]